MKKRIFSLSLALLLIGGMALPVHAESSQGSDNWSVTFTSDNKMNSNFTTSGINESIGGMQPGDDVTFTIKLQNGNSTATDWWIKNEVVKSLEENSPNGASGGAYEYVLQYTDRTGATVTLFDSDTVGGEDNPSGVGVGLHAATVALEEYIYLDTLALGQSGTVTLKVSLDGETQGNAYQDTLAELNMDFAVELNPEENIVTNLVQQGSNYETRTLVNEGDGGNDATLIQLNDIVRTDDQTNLTPYYIAMAISGAFILILAIFSMKRSKEEKKEAE